MKILKVYRIESGQWDTERWSKKYITIQYTTSHTLIHKKPVLTNNKPQYKHTLTQKARILQ